MSAKTRRSDLFEYDAFRFRQRNRRGPQLVMFHAPVEELVTWADVRELGPRSTGAQREKREAKVEAIEKFLRADERNTIPTAVILAFVRRRASFGGLGRKSVNATRGTLSIVGGTSAYVVDGQHRLHGINAFDPKMHIPVIGLLEADKVEEAFQFLVINNKATRVPVTHTKALLARMKETELASRLKAAKIAFDAEGINDVDLVNSDTESPFFESIDWPTTPAVKRMVQATAIELSLAYLAGLGLSEFDDRDVRRSVFLTMWRVVRESWSDLWKVDSRLVSKVGIVCLTRFIADFIVSWADNDELEIDVEDLAEIEKQTRKIIAHMNPEFWRVPWAEKAHGGFDTNQGRDRVLAALRQLYRNGKGAIEWYVDIDIIDRASADATAKTKPAGRGMKKGKVPSN